MIHGDEFRQLAERIDPSSAAALGADYKASPICDLACLIGTAFPPLAPRHDWQLAALAVVADEGWARARSRPSYLERLRAAMTAGETCERALRRVSWVERARIALRELLPVQLGGAPVETTAYELSQLAEALLEIALDEAQRETVEKFGEPTRADGEPSQMIVIGFGKLGGKELNAGSDVDLKFIYDTDDSGTLDGAGDVSPHQYWVNVAQRIVKLFEDQTEDGFVWRVDLRLRPHGSKGPVAISLAAAERYYETFGRTWERAALLRARVVAGDERLGEQFQREVITPFVYRQQVDPSIAETFVDMVDRSRIELSEDPARDLKLGPGGIREAEFFIQSLQVIWGGREQMLRTTGSRAALARLLSRGFVTARESEDISTGLWLLRKVEHSLQSVTGIQTHTLPEPGPQLEHLARVLGYGDGAELNTALDEVRATIHGHFGTLAPEHADAPSPFRTVLWGIHEQDTNIDKQVIELFGTAETGDHLRALAAHPDGLFGKRTLERYPDFGETMLGAIAECPDPEVAAAALRSLFGRMTAPGAYITALQKDHQALQRLVTVLGASAFVARAMIATPLLLDRMIFSSRDPLEHSATQLIDEELERRERSDDAVEDRESFIGALRRAKTRVMVGVAIADLSGGLPMERLTGALTELADVSLQRALGYGPVGGTEGLAILAVGKLGGRDVGYTSDLDVLFIFDSEFAPEQATAAEFFSRRAHRVISLISEAHADGPGYELDTRLRPSGSQGMLVTSLGAFARYHRVPVPGEAPSSQTPSVLISGADWERQALVRARYCTGDEKLGSMAMDIAQRAAYGAGAPDPAEMHRLRTRMELELGCETPSRFDIKLGRGGLQDVEFAVQFLQMRYGDDLSVRVTPTLDGLAVLRAAGYLSDELFEPLLEGYSFLYRLALRLQLVEGVSDSRLELGHPRLRSIARSLGFRDLVEMDARSQLIERYRQLTSAVREAYLKVLGFDEEPSAPPSVPRSRRW